MQERTAEFAITCTHCGNEIPVSAVMAGTEVSCSCGTVNDVPLLSSLRKLAGKAAYITNTAEEIKRVLADGELPFPRDCVVCRMRTEEIFECITVCEQPAARSESDPGWGFFNLLVTPLALMAGWIVFVDSEGAPEQADAHGRELVVSTPLAMCQRCHGETRGLTKQSGLRALLQTVPIYARLLEEFPEATIVARG